MLKFYLVKNPIAVVLGIAIRHLPPRYPDIYEQMKKIYRPKNIKKVLNLTKTLFLWLRNYLNQN